MSTPACRFCQIKRCPSLSVCMCLLSDFVNFWKHGWATMNAFLCVCACCAFTSGCACLWIFLQCRAESGWAEEGMMEKMETVWKKKMMKCSRGKGGKQGRKRGVGVVYTVWWTNTAEESEPEALTWQTVESSWRGNGVIINIFSLLQVISRDVSNCCYTLHLHQACFSEWRRLRW